MPIRYSPAADTQLDDLEANADDDLWSGICAVLDLIAARPDSAEARREAIRTPDGRTIWRIPVRHPTIDAMFVLWAEQAGAEYMLYIGPMPGR